MLLGKPRFLPMPWTLDVVTSNILNFWLNFELWNLKRFDSKFWWNEGALGRRFPFGPLFKKNYWHFCHERIFFAMSIVLLVVFVWNNWHIRSKCKVYHSAPLLLFLQLSAFVRLHFQVLSAPTPPPPLSRLDPCERYFWNKAIWSLFGLADLAAANCPRELGRVVSTQVPNQGKLFSCHYRSMFWCVFKRGDR